MLNLKNVIALIENLILVVSLSYGWNYISFISWNCDLLPLSSIRSLLARHVLNLCSTQDTTGLRTQLAGLLMTVMSMLSGDFV